MDTSNVRYGIVILSIILGVGFAIGRLVAPEREAEEGPAGDAGASQDKTVATPSFLQQRVTSLEEDLARQQQHKAVLAREIYGDPLAWPETLPERYRTTIFEENVRSAVTACAAGVEIAGFECDEPPCLAMFRGGEEGWWEELVHSCPGWIGVYGSDTSVIDGWVNCQGGRTERYAILGPVAPDLTGEGPEARQRWELRWRQRAGEIKAAWSCSTETADTGN